MADSAVLLDTDVLIEILRNRPQARAWLDENAAVSISLPVVVHMEALAGARSKAEMSALRSHLQAFDLHHIDADDSRVASMWFEQHHLPHGVGILDRLIGAISRRLGMPLLTFNEKHFRCLDGVAARAPYQRRHASES